MIDIDCRPDVREFMLEAVDRFGDCKEVKDALMIPVSRWQKSNDWYGLGLVFRPNTSDITAYLCHDNVNEGPQAYICTFYNHETLDEIINEAEHTLCKCPQCHKEVDIEDVYVTTTSYMCKDCYSKIRVMK